MPLSADDIKHAFAALSEELDRRQRQAEIVVVGGAALVLLFRARESTKDVDAFFLKPEASVLRETSEAVARRLDLPGDWLNDAAKGYLVGRHDRRVAVQLTGVDRARSVYGTAPGNETRCLA